VALKLAGPRPHIKAELQVERIDASLLEAELGSDLMQAVDADLTLAVSEIAYGEIGAGPSRLAVKLANGTIDVAMEAMELYGGQATGRVAYDGSPPLARLEARLKATGVDGGKLSAALTGSERVRGSADIALDLAAVGASREELVARLGGTAHLSVKAGALVGLDVPALLGHVMSGIAEGWTAAGDGETPFSRLEASFAVEDGIAETADLALEGPAVGLAGRGSVDLLRRRLELKMKPQSGGSAEEAPAARLAIPVIVAGPWSTPRIYPDVEGILENPAQAFEGLRRRLEASAAKLDLGPAAAPTEPGGAAVTR
jgi:AsmA protein